MKPDFLTSNDLLARACRAIEVCRNSTREINLDLVEELIAEIERLRAALDTARAGVQAAYEAGVEDGKTGSIRPRGCGPVAADRDDNGAEK